MFWIPDSAPDQKPTLDQAQPDQQIPDLTPDQKTPIDQALPDKLVILDQAVPDQKVNPCGNGKLDTGEPCDGSLLGGKTCKSQGFHSGTIKCSSSCALDLAGCGKCNDYLKNGDETDIDCGGAACPKCKDGKACKAAADCVSGICKNGSCACKPNACGGCAILKPAHGAPCGTCGVQVCNGLNATKCSDAPDMIALSTYCIDPYEASVWSSTACKGTQYGATKDDYPLGFPNNVASKGVTGIPATETVYACAVKGVLPSTNLTWYQGKRACENSGKRLCTEAEWTAACQGGAGNAFPYGKAYVGTACNTADAKQTGVVTCGKLTSCVGGYTGIFDMSGNVWEFTSDATGKSCTPSQGGSYYHGKEYAGCKGLVFKCNLGSGSGGSKFHGFRCCRTRP